VLENSGHSHDGAFARGYVAGVAEAESRRLRKLLDKAARSKLID
jgi:hypothetical protein